MDDDHPLDGKYQVTSTTSYVGPLEKRSDGVTFIANSRTVRYDDAKCKWTSTFEMISDNEVKMTSIADATEAAIDFLLTAPDGTPTRGPVTYEAILKLSRKGDLIQLSGPIDYNLDLVFLTLRQIA